MIHFMGTCKYTLTKSFSRPEDDDCAFNVEVKAEHRGRNRRVSFIRMIDVMLAGHKFRLMKHRIFMLDGIRATVPKTVGDVVVRMRGRDIQVLNKKCGINVQFDGRSKVEVNVPRKKYAKKMTGICGTCDGDKDNDFVTKDGTDVYESKNRYSQIGDSYTVPDDSDQPEDSDKCFTKDVILECTGDMAKNVMTNDYCGLITDNDGPFRKCIASGKLPMEKFVSSCKMDVCAVQPNDDEMDKARCKALSAFSQECMTHGHLVDWRMAAKCKPKCQANSQYVAEAPACPATCANPNAPLTCKGAVRPDCVCDDGYLLSGRKCVPKQQCGCTDEKGNYYRNKAVWTSKTCETRHTCSIEDGTPTIVNEDLGQCHNDAACGNINGVHKCICNPGYIGDGYESCKRKRGLRRSNKCPKCHEDATCVLGKCVCDRGLMGDGVKSCQRACQCQAHGDPHYRTYDGTMLHFMGSCKYTLTKAKTDPKKDKCWFNVEVKNEHRGRNKRATFVRMADITIGKTTVRILKRRVVLIGDVEHQLPIANKDISVYISGRFVMVKKPGCEFEAGYDGISVVRVSTPPSYSRRMTGICGDCDGNGDNDYKTKDGTDVIDEPSRYTLIGNSYAVVDDSDKPSKAGECKAQELKVDCDKETTELIKLDQNCGLMLNEAKAFGECIQSGRVNTKRYYSSCEMDMCMSWKEPTRRGRAQCRIMQAMAIDCAENGFDVAWRTKEFCPLKCGRHEIFSRHVPGCEATCTTPDGPANCREPPTEGCMCRPGYLRSGRNCVRVNKCGCTDKRGYYRSNGATWTSRDCQVEYRCTTRSAKPFISEKDTGGCDDNGRCGVRRGVRKCICRRGFYKSGPTTCKKT